MNQFQTADSELIQSHISIFFDTRNRGDMSYLCMLSLFEVLQDRSRSNDTVLKMVHTKALEILHVEMLQQLLPSCLVCKYPIIEFEGKELITKLLLKLLLLASLKKHLFRREIRQ